MWATIGKAGKHPSRTAQTGASITHRKHLSRRSVRIDSPILSCVPELAIAVRWGANMKAFLRAIAAAIALASLAGCSANHNSIFRLNDLKDAPATVITIDAKQRSILVAHRLLKDGKPDPNSVRAFCAEPSPDVFSVIAQSLSAGGSFGKSANPASMEAALNLSYGSAEQGSTIPRTQTINMLRELMFRTCERYLSGGYDATELSLQAIRDQRLMVSILAIEQLTGAVTPKPVMISATGSGGAGASGEAIVRLDDARKDRDKAAGAFASASTAYEQVNGTDKVCDAIEDKKEDELTDAQKAKVKPAQAPAARVQDGAAPGGLAGQPDPF